MATNERARLEELRARARMDELRAKKPKELQSPSFLAQLGSAAVRPLAKGIAALPNMVMDAGVGARNLITGSNYEMPSEMFNRALDQVTLPPEGIGKVAEGVSTALVGGATGNPTAGAKVPANFVPAGAQPTATEATLQAARGSGYVVPPATAKPGFFNKLIEGFAGKVSVAQRAAEKNQEVTNAIARRTLGMADDAPINRSGLEAIRREAGKIYRAIDQAGDFVADDAYGKALDSLADDISKVSKSFPKANVGVRKEIGELAESLKVPQMSADDALEYLKQLRADSKTNLGKLVTDPAKRALGRAQDKAADILESLVMRNLRSQGLNDLADAFDGARKLIAQTHTVERALNPATGNVSAVKLANELKKGRISGELGTAARFGGAFPRAAREVNESMLPVSPLDFYAAGGLSAYLGDLTPMLYPLARSGTREAILSQALQQGLGRPTAQQVTAGSPALMQELLNR